MNEYIAFLIIAVPILLITGHTVFWIRFGKLAKDVRRIAEALDAKQC